MIYSDSNLDGEISDREIIKEVLGDGSSQKSMQELLLEMIKRWAEEKKRKVLNGISQGTLNVSESFNQQQKLLDNLKDDKIINNKEFFVKKRTIRSFIEIYRYSSR